MDRRLFRAVAVKPPLIYRFRFVVKYIHVYITACLFNDTLFIFTGHEPDADLGPLISPAAKQRVCDLVQSGIDQGAEVLLDGRNVKVPGYDKGNFVGPTILHKVDVSAFCSF